MTETVVDLSAPEAPTMTTDEANRLATGLVGAAAAERTEAPDRRTKIEHVTVAVEAGVVPHAHPYTYHGAGASGWVTIGPLVLSGEWAVLEATLVAALAAVREQSTGPVGA